MKANKQKKCKNNYFVTKIIIIEWAGAIYQI